MFEQKNCKVLVSLKTYFESLKKGLFYVFPKFSHYSFQCTIFQTKRNVKTLTSNFRLYAEKISKFVEPIVELCQKEVISDLCDCLRNSYHKSHSFFAAFNSLLPRLSIQLRPSFPIYSSSTFKDIEFVQLIYYSFQFAGH